MESRIKQYQLESALSQFNTGAVIMLGNNKKKITPFIPRLCFIYMFYKLVCNSRPVWGMSH